MVQASIGETIEQGSFVQLRGRPWLVEELRGDGTDLETISLSCIADDAQGERLEVLWDAEIGAAVLDEDGWRNVGQGLPDSPEVLAAHLRTIRWRSATAADRDLLQAPFRAGIRLDAGRTGERDGASGGSGGDLSRRAGGVDARSGAARLGDDADEPRR